MFHDGIHSARLRLPRPTNGGRTDDLDSEVAEDRLQLAVLWIDQAPMAGYDNAAVGPLGGADQELQFGRAQVVAPPL